MGGSGRDALGHFFCKYSRNVGNNYSYNYSDYLLQNEVIVAVSIVYR